MMRDDAETSPEDALRRWLGEDASTVTVVDDEAGEGRARSLRRAGVVLLVLLPWIALGLAVASGDPVPAPTASPLAGGPSGADERPTTHSAGQATGMVDAAPEAAASDRATVDGASTGAAERGTAAGARSRPAPAEAAPTALRLVRDEVTRTGTRTSALDAAAAEHPTPVAPGVWLVRVHAVVLRGDRTRWHAADHEVWAVPIGRRGDDLVGLERPWRIAVAPTRTATLAWRRTTIDAAAARTALRRAGFDVERVEAQRHPSLRTIVRVRAGRNWVWLRTTPRPTVLGAEPAVAP